MEARSVDRTKSHYRRVIRHMSPLQKIEFLLQLVGTRTAMVRTYVALYNGKGGV